MADKEFKIKIGTDGDPSGAKEVENAIDDVTEAGERLEDVKPPLQPADVRPSERSISDLTTEVQRLQRELSEVPVGGKAFVDLAGKVKEAQIRLNDAEGQARKLGATVGRGGNAGAAVLEFSRAFEDAQYGIRGVLNNLPNLIAMLGGGAGLAGVISIAAVAGTQLWERLSQTESSEDAIDAVAEAAEKLTTKLKALRDRRKEIEEIPTSDMGAALKEETTALKLQTDGFRLNIQALKDRIAVAAALDAVLTQGALGDVDRAVGDGTISPDEATRRKSAIEEGAKQRELQRTQELSKLDDTVALEAKAAAQRELQLAAFKKRAAEERLREAEEEETRLKAALARRNEIDSLRAQLDEADAQLTNDSFEGRDRGDLEEQRQRAEQDRQSPYPNIPGERILASLEQFVSVAERLAELEREGLPPGQEQITQETSELLGNIAKLREAVGDAAKEISERTANLQLVNQASDAALERGSSKRQDQQNLGDAGRIPELQEQLAGVDQKAGEEVGKLLDQVLAMIGNSASQPGVTEKAGQLRDLISNGLQSGESDQARQLLLQLVGKIDTGNKERGVAYQKILTVLEAASGSQSTIIGRLDELERQFRTNSRAGGQGNPNP